MLRERMRSTRPLTPFERVVSAVTAALAVATVALAVTANAQADPSGVLPEDGAYYQEPGYAGHYVAAKADPPALPADNGER